MRLKNLFRATSILLSIGVACSFTGCVDNRSTLYVVRSLFIDPTGPCELSEDLPANARGKGFYDLTVAEAGDFGYGFAILIANQLQPLGDNDTLRAETSRIQLQGAEISVEGVDGAAGPEYTVPFSGTIDPEPSEQPGEAAVFIEAIPTGAITETGDYLLTIRVFGQTLGGMEVESGDFVWPVTVCRGCLNAGCVEDLGLPCQPGSDYPLPCTAYGNCPDDCTL